MRRIGLDRTKFVKLDYHIDFHGYMRYGFVGALEKYKRYNNSMFICCNADRTPSTIFDNLPHCIAHDKPVQFICSKNSCREAPLLCIECLNDHKDHKWISFRNFFTPDVKEMMETGNSTTTRRIEEAANVIQQLFLSFRERTIQQITRLQQAITQKLYIVNQNNHIEIRYGHKISQESIAQLLTALDKEKSVEWVQNLKTFLESAIGEAVKTIDNIMDDLEAATGSEWEQRTHLENELALKQLKTHLHYHKEKDPNYFKFNPQAKHPGIQLDEDQLQAIFKKNLPSRPAVIASNPITPKIHRLSFEIKKLDKTAFIFAATTIFIGVCNPITVKSVGLRRISEVGKGAYMIGSSGWSYHHKNNKYDRKNIVGFSFGEGDKIDVQVEIQQPGEIRFSKQGKIFKSSFSMPLDLTQKEILQLKPCVSFDGDEGAIVRLCNL